jgi:hypothetical protein
MITGKKLQSMLADARRSMERDSVAISGLIVDSERSLEKMSARQADIWKKFASVHLIEGDIGSATLDRLRAEREARIDKAHRTINMASKELSELESNMAKIAERRVAADAAIKTKNDQIEASASSDAVVASSRTKLSAIHVAVVAATKRKADADLDVANKRPGYDNDELFRYLKGRKYGSDGYRAFPMIATLDRLLASSIGFDKAAQDFELLTGLPGWIEAKLAELDAEQRSEEAILKDAMTKHENGLEPLIKKRSEIDREMSLAVASHDAAEINNRNAVRQLKEIANGSDDIQAQILSEGVSILKKERGSALERLARRTKSDDDDIALAEILCIEADAAKIVAERDILKTKLSTTNSRLKNIETVEKRLKNEGWADSDHKFKDGSYDISGLLQGAILADAFWRSAKSGHIEPQPDYSSTWGGPSGGSFGGSSNTKSGGFGGSDSWTTGGGFADSDDKVSTGGGF